MQFWNCTSCQKARNIYKECHCNNPRRAAYTCILLTITSVIVDVEIIPSPTGTLITANAISTDMSTSSIGGIALIDVYKKCLIHESNAMLAHHCKYDCQCWDCILQDKYRNSCLECCYRFVCILSCAPHIHQCLKECDKHYSNRGNGEYNISS